MTTGTQASKARNIASNILIFVPDHRIASFELYLCERKLFRRRNVLVDRAEDLETTARK
jgi:hypothetical protein